MGSHSKYNPRNFGFDQHYGITGAGSLYAPLNEEKIIRDQFKHFIVDEDKMAKTNKALFSHCLPLRRNIKATDGVMDSDYCVAIQEAGNRKHVQKSLLSKLLNKG